MLALPVFHVGDILVAQALSTAVGEAVRGLDAVSYTHLDVYKRQDGGGEIVGQRKGRRAGGNYAGPVSYTHLDVYKRQPLPFSPFISKTKLLPLKMSVPKTPVLAW